MKQLGSCALCTLQVSSRGDLWGDIPPLIFKTLKIPPECRKLIAKIRNSLRVQCAESAHTSSTPPPPPRVAKSWIRPWSRSQSRGFRTSIQIFDNIFGAQCMMGRRPLPTGPIKSVLAYPPPRVTWVAAQWHWCWTPTPTPTPTVEKSWMKPCPVYTA